MKILKISFLFIIQLAVFQMSFSQADVVPTDENGRIIGEQMSVPPSVQKTTVEDGGTFDPPNAVDDADIPGSYNQGNPVDVFYGDGATPSPIDEDIMKTQAELMERLTKMEEIIEMLEEENKLLLAENEGIREDLAACCEKGGEKGTSFLFQNAPNPFDNATEIQFFVPESTSKAIIEIRDMTGKILQSHNIQQRGLSTLTIDAGAYLSGSYVYTLSIDGEFVDSKVMIMTE